MLGKPIQLERFSKLIKYLLDIQELFNGAVNRWWSLSVQINDNEAKFPFLV